MPSHTQLMQLESEQPFFDAVHFSIKSHLCQTTSLRQGSIRAFLLLILLRVVNDSSSRTREEGTSSGILI
jgi:hypothetical protein